MVISGIQGLLYTYAAIHTVLSFLRMSIGSLGGVEEIESLDEVNERSATLNVV